MTQALTLARPYARAAFALANDHGHLVQWTQALGFASHVAAQPQVAGLLGNPKLTDADAVALLAPPQLEGDASERFARFLKLLVDNRRLVLLPEITGLYEQLRADAERVVKACVTSAQVLPDAELESIRAALAKRFGCEIELDTALDETLIGGAVIDTGDMVIDGSLRGKLERMQTALAQ